MPSGVLEESPTRKKVKKKNISQVFWFFFQCTSDKEKKNLTALLHCYQLTLPTKALNVLLS